jgi:signal transduction histidine kinase/ligand-binding sensor domain-containing protein
MRLFVLGQIKSKCLPRSGWRWLARLLLGGLMGVFVPALTRAQFRFDHWTTEQGLPQNSVLAIAQTRDGYLWLATYNGLVRFDGARFSIFDKNNTPAFKTSRFPDLFEDTTGALWLSVEDDGVIRYQNGVFTSLTTAQGLPSTTVLNVQSTADGAVLISTAAGTFWWRNGQLVPYEWGAPGAEAKVYLGRSGTHWSTDQTGLHARDKNGRVTHTAVPAEPKFIINAKLLEDRRGALWIAPPRYGLFKVKDGVMTDYTQRFKLGTPATVIRILEDTDGSLWFATLNAGLLHFSNDAAETLTTYTTADGLSGNGIRGLFRDREGTLWVGTDGGGLNRMTRRFLSGYSEAEGLVGNVAHAVLADRTGNVWVATHNGLSKLSNGAITNYQRGETAGSLPLRGLQALYEDRSGRLWIGGYDGLCSFKDGVFSPGFPDLNVWAIHEDRQGTLWVGTHFGLVKFKDGVRANTYTTKDGLPKDTVRAIHEDKQGTLWLGTEGGLVKFKDGRFTVFRTKDGLVNDRVWSMHEDADGVLWLGTFDGGLSRFKDGRFTNYTTAQGLYNNGVFQILEDGRGHLWMSCYRGLYRVSKQQLNDFADGKISAITSTAYGKADGMLSSDCNGGRQPSGVRTSDGRLWFTTLKGVAVVNSEAIAANPAPPSVLIESAMLDRAEVDIRKGLRVMPGRSNLEIAYTALTFIKAEQVRFKYQLLGQDPNWIEAGTRRVANYSYLRPGQYSFKVIAANSDGVWNNEGAQLTITVLPAFYQTWWFRLLALLALIGGIGLIFKRRLDQANRARLAQEEFSRRLIDSQEQERKRIAAELHDSLGQNLLVIKNYALMGLNTANGGNPLREHLDEISEAASQSIAEVRQISHNLRPYQLERLGLTNTLETMLHQIANASDIGFTTKVEPIDGLFAPADEISVYRIVQEALNNILKHSDAKEASVHIERADGEIQITITDDGRGFTLEPANRAELQTRGLGLTGTAERVRILGGKLNIQSAPGQGTTIYITLKPTTHGSPN